MCITGPVIKVVSNKVDYFDGSVQENLQDLQELARRAEVESEELQQRDAARAEEAAAQQQGTTKSKKKKIRSENKGNFSSYRNKSFIPNASRVANVDAAAGRLPESSPVLLSGELADVPFVCALQAVVDAADARTRTLWRSWSSWPRVPGPVMARTRRATKVAVTRTRRVAARAATRKVQRRHRCNCSTCCPCIPGPNE
jgi:hypothetical protein